MPSAAQTATRRLKGQTHKNAEDVTETLTSATHTKGSFPPSMTLQGSVQPASKITSKHAGGKQEERRQAGAGEAGRPRKRPLPHKHEEEAGSGHQRSSAGRRQHPQHGNNWGDGDSRSFKHTFDLRSFSSRTEKTQTRQADQEAPREQLLILQPTHSTTPVWCPGKIKEFIPALISQHKMSGDPSPEVHEPPGAVTSTFLLTEALCGLEHR